MLQKWATFSNLVWYRIDMNLVYRCLKMGFPILCLLLFVTQFSIMIYFNISVLLCNLFVVSLLLLLPKLLQGHLMKLKLSWICKWIYLHKITVHNFPHYLERSLQTRWLRTNREPWKLQELSWISPNAPCFWKLVVCLSSIYFRKIYLRKS